jgi:peptide/nickel transport system ATP-binding protein
MSEVMLSARNLSVSYYNTKVVSSISFNIYKGETYALVGESGCGKSTIASSIMRTLPEIAQIDPDSQIVYSMGTNAIDLLKVPENEFSRRFRWKEIAMVPQGALNALNPTIRVKDHFIETAKAHDLEKDEALERAWKLLEAVKLDPQRVLNLYPIELSGGMKQRVLIAMALFLNPKLVLLDEPTTALDVLTQREILILLGELKTKYSLTYMLITHDIALVADLADRVAVIYAGRIVEDSSIDNIFYEPKHPYTIGLLRAVPKLGEFKEPEVIPGSTPDYRRLPPGCKFNPRCPFAMDVCRKEEPPLVEIDKGRFVACWLYMKR